MTQKMLGPKQQPLIPVSTLALPILPVTIHHLRADRNQTKHQGTQAKRVTEDIARPDVE